MPKISVIVPVYKVEAYLQECVDSILTQTFSDFELILVDDGSPDRCPAMCEEYAKKDSRVKVIHQQNGGLSAARNSGMEIAEGEYLTFVDSDDQIHKEYLGCLLEILEMANADMSICSYLQFEIDPPVCGEEDCSDIRVLSGREACMELFGDNVVTFTTTWGKLYRRAILENISFPVGKIHEDEATTYKALYGSERVAVMDRAMYFYRINPHGIMNSRSFAKSFDAVVAFEERICFFRDNGDAELAAKSQLFLQVFLSKRNISAVRDDVSDEIPEQYRMPISKCLKILRKNVSDNSYTYFLAMIHPKWLRSHAYWRKFKKMLGIPCK